MTTSEIASDDDDYEGDDGDDMMMMMIMLNRTAFCASLLVSREFR